MHLYDMDLNSLLSPEGHPCACGKIHRCDLRTLEIGSGVVKRLPEVLRKHGICHPFVVMDSNTRRAAGERVEALLTEAGIPFLSYTYPEGAVEPDEHAVGALTMRFDPACDGVVAVGSGVISDCCKVLCHAIGRTQVTVSTAPSMDGYASNCASMILGQLKVTMYNACPAAIIADTDILKTAPDRMLQAGLGDMAAKYISLAEWRVTNQVNGEYYCPEVAGLMRKAVAEIAAHADGLMQREDAAIEAVIRGLVLSGLAMAFAEVSRPASGLEHYFSHLWEMDGLLRHLPSELHGIQVGVGTLLTARIAEKLAAIETPDRQRAESFVKNFDHEAWRQRVRRDFGPAAEAVLRLEEKADKNGAGKHALRLENICRNWKEIRRAFREEIPAFDRLYDMMARCGMPLRPADIGKNDEETRRALIGSRDIRDKYMISSLLWDLGLLEETAGEVRA